MANIIQERRAKLAAGLTAVRGLIKLTESRYVCRDCGAEWYPEDEHEPCPECRSWNVTERKDAARND